ncbi:DMT family transporter [Caulobacter sp. 17J80-11]|uniref:DMT family transporter n=1 Tax=Caulobacter sp. 17J80-11 TaxID=2763502 RepID=UPI001653CD75|nr:EamA family transporter [Caulobacter sp. 17J80-11]MBC6983083.1 EamA family transporter [Caulobacter sp. 17J80-11]
MTDLAVSRPSPATVAVLSVAACSVIWGTTWYAITLQLGVVPTVASITYRFGLAALILFAICLITRKPAGLTKAQHVAAFGQGLFTFAVDYAFVYFAEERVASAVVAVIFAGLAFLNLVLFRLFAGQKAPKAAWAGAALGMAGVGVLSAAELFKAELDPRAIAGVGCAVLAVIGAGVGNLFAWRGQKAGAPVLQATAWAMAYGTGLLFLYGLVTGVQWTFSFTPSYVLSLLHLAVFGSVVAFLIYFSLARSSGYALASYVSALTPPVAMLMSVAFEHASFGLGALGGLVLVLGGQVLLIKGKEA